MMTKLDTRSISLTVADGPYEVLEPARRLIVLVPPEADYGILTHRVWELAHASGSQILFLSLCADEIEESSLRRQLVTMSALVQDGKVHAAAQIEMGSNWVNAIRLHLQNGDAIVCCAEQRTGLRRKLLSPILQASLNAPMYILSGLSPQNPAQSNLLSEVLGWTGSIAIIGAAFLFQIRITSLSEAWLQSPMLILSMLGEIWLIWSWNRLLG
jgi:hypothetical protein